MSIEITGLPENIRCSKILSSEDKSKLANISESPMVDPAFEDATLKNIIQYYSIDPDEMETELHLYAKKLLEENKVNEAWQVLLTTTLL
jgi:hypothetical protein